MFYVPECSIPRFAASLPISTSNFINSLFPCVIRYSSDLLLPAALGVMRMRGRNAGRQLSSYLPIHVLSRNLKKWRSCEFNNWHALMKKKGAWLDRCELKASHTHRDIWNDCGRAIPEIVNGHLVPLKMLRG